MKLGDKVAFLERLTSRTPMMRFTGIIVGRFGENCFQIRVGQGKHKRDFLVHTDSIIKEKTNGELPR